MDPKDVELGQAVVFVDSKGTEHQAIVNQVWRDVAAYQTVTKVPGLNLVYVNPDSTMNDQYGRQILRETSVVHRSNQPAPGRYWRLAGEA